MSSLSSELFVYDLVCMRYHQVKHELHFWCLSLSLSRSLSACASASLMHGIAA